MPVGKTNKIVVGEEVSIEWGKCFIARVPKTRGMRGQCSLCNIVLGALEHTEIKTMGIHATRDVLLVLKCTSVFVT